MVFDIATDASLVGSISVSLAQLDAWILLMILRNPILYQFIMKNCPPFHRLLIFNMYYHILHIYIYNIIFINWVQDLIPMNSWVNSLALGV